LAAALLLLMMLTPAAWSQVPVLAGKSWSTLSPAQRELLAPLATQWPQLDAGSQEHWAALSQRYPKLKPDEQQRLRERLSDWAALSPAERQQARQGFTAAQRLAPSDRQQKWERYKALSPEERQALKERRAKRLAAQSPALPAALPLVPPRPAASVPAGHPLTRVAPQLDPSTLLPRRAPAASAP
jgi:hypothetical protein